MDTIAIAFPKVKVNAEIKDLTFDNLEDMIFEIDLREKAGFQERNMPFFAHRYPLPGIPEFFINR